MPRGTHPTAPLETGTVEVDMADVEVVATQWFILLEYIVLNVLLTIIVIC